MKLTGGQMVVEVLVREGVPYLVGIPGHGTLGLCDALVGEDRVRVIQVRHEQAAVHLADAYYRVAGVPLAVFTSIGPGAMNTVVGVASCYVDSIPVLVLTGNSHTHMAGRGVLQEIERAADANSLAVFAPIAKRTWRADRVDRLPRILQRAFAEMLTGRRGPVAVDLPMDVQCDAADVTLLDPAQYRAAGTCLPDQELVARAAELLYAAERPVILAGGGVLSARGWDELRALAEFSGAAVITTMMGKGAFPEDHPLSALHAGSKGTACGNRLAARADVLLAVGTRFADETASSYRAGASFAIPPTRLIHIDADATEIGKNYPAAVGIAADAKATLGAMLAWLQGHCAPKDPAASAYFQEVQQERGAWLATLRRQAASGHEPVTISRLIAEVRGFLRRDAIVLTSSGNLQAQWFQEAMVYEPGTNLTAGGFSTMGWTVPAALGARLAAPGRQVLGLVGDGDFLMTVQELATAVQYDLSVVYVVANNAGWIAIRDLQAAVYGPERAEGAEFLRGREPVTPDLAAVARGFGCHAEQISRPGEVRPALDRAFASGRPSVVEVLVERTYPLSGSPATGWWDVPVPAYLAEQRARYERERGEEQ
jgi:acetolactate synthase I/II/III large subunit